MATKESEWSLLTSKVPGITSYCIFLQNFSGDHPDAAVFDEYKGKNCHGRIPPPTENVYTHNPMKEFIEGHTEHVDTRYGY